MIEVDKERLFNHAKNMAKFNQIIMSEKEFDVESLRQISVYAVVYTQELICELGFADEYNETLKNSNQVNHK